MNKIYHLTPEGKAELETELTSLKARRGEIADKIAEARDFGDLSENAEYDSAREEQALTESRIAEIEDILSNAEIIKASAGSDSVQVGSRVELTVNRKKVVYVIVGPVEADPVEGKISNESPIGQALLGKKVGDTVTIETPKGSVSYNITAIN